MSTPKFGGAKAAADVLGLSLSQFNSIRLQATYAYDPTAEMKLTPVDPESADLREHLEGKHLIAPTLAGKRYAGGRWEYNLTLLQSYRERGWSGARFPEPSDSGPTSDR